MDANTDTRGTGVGAPKEGQPNFAASAKLQMDAVRQDPEATRKAGSDLISEDTPSVGDRVKAAAQNVKELGQLNKYEYAAGGEFGFGTAQQYGEADIKGRDFSNQKLQRANFTAADCRDCNFSGANLQAAYLIKTVVARADFEGADLSDTLADRAVFVEAKLRNAILQRSVLTRSDLNQADVYGADFTNALVDKSQQMALCKYADGVNPVTGVDTRKSLGCGSRRAFRASVPSNPEGPQVSEQAKRDFRATINNQYE
ncbi:hypothetical protein N2152v2_009060 [Parachlorella kessleri]